MQLAVLKRHLLSFYVISNLVQLFLFEELILNKVVFIYEHLHELSLRVVKVSLRVEAVFENLALIVDSCGKALELD